jgi:hypothetical protein
VFRVSTTHGAAAQAFLARVESIRDSMLNCEVKPEDLPKDLPRSKPQP